MKSPIKNKIKKEEPKKTKNIKVKKIKEDKPKVSLKEKVKEIKATMKANNEFRRDVGKLADHWKEIMAQTNTYNQHYHTFTLSHIKKESYGWSCRIYTPDGLYLDQLERLKPIIQDNLSCLFFYQKKNCQNFVTAKFVMDGFKVLDFTVEKVLPWEVYIGNGIDGSRVVIDLRKFPHIMLSGANGSGKSRLLDCILTTLICSCSEEELQLYLVQVAKNDLVIYEDAVQCRAFCDDLEKANIMLDYIMKKMKERESLIKPIRKQGKGSDVSDYNKLYPNRKMPICFVVFDEYASITDTSNDSKETKKTKQEIVGKVERIAQYGRALGVFLCVCLQRPTAEMLSPFVKAQSNLRISGKQNNQKSSEVAMDDAYVAQNLDNRVFVYKTNDYDYIKTPTIDDKVILDNIKPYLKPNHRNLFDDLEKLKKSNKPEEIKIKKDIEIEEDSIQNTPQNKGTAPVPNKKQLKKIKDKEKSKEVIDEEKDTQETIISNNIKINIPQIPLDFSKVDPRIAVDETLILEENTKKIPNFVPYNPTKPEIIIDKTLIDFSKTTKPNKEVNK